MFDTMRLHIEVTSNYVNNKRQMSMILSKISFVHKKAMIFVKMNLCKIVILPWHCQKKEKINEFF